MTRLLAAGALLITTACFQVQEGGTIIPIEIAEGRDASQILVPVTIGDSPQLRFVLDTGSAESVLDLETGQALGLDPIPGSEREITGAGAGSRAFEVAVEGWQLGDVPLEGGRLVVFDIPAPAGEARPDGLLGSNVLDDFGRVTIDYEGEELLLGGR